MNNSGKPKILMFGWEFPPFNSGGLGIACRGLLKALYNQGASTTFVMPKKLPISSKFFKIAFADENPSSSEDIDQIFKSGYLPANHLTKIGFSERYRGLRLIDQVRIYALLSRRIAKTEIFDIIHAHDWLSFLSGIEAKKVSGKPLVVHVHATEFDRGGGNGINNDVYNIEKMGMEQADRVITVSNFTKKLISEKYGIPDYKISVVHNGIDGSDFKLSSGKVSKNLLSFKERGYKIILFVGRITLQKGPDYFVSLADKILKFEPKTIFIVSGSGDMEGKIIRDVASRGIAGNFVFTGFLRGEELTQIYSIADAYVMPSVSEPFGIVPLEAMVSGTPTVISKQSGVSEVVSHAFKSDFWDILDMTDKLVSIIRHRPLQECLSRNGKKEASSVDWQSAAKKCLSVYNSLCYV